MNGEIKHLRQFGNFRLDTQKKVLWHNGESVPMPLKELEVLCMLVKSRGELVTKDEMLDEVWANSFVEESNLSRHIYLLRKTLKDLGAKEDLIQNIPRRGYRFTGDVSEIEGGEIVLEKRTQTRTLIEIQEETRGNGKVELEHKRPRVGPSSGLRIATLGILLVVLTGAAGFIGYQNWQANSSAAEIKSIAVLTAFNETSSRFFSEKIGA